MLSGISYSFMINTTYFTDLSCFLDEGFFISNLEHKMSS